VNRKKCFIKTADFGNEYRIFDMPWHSQILLWSSSNLSIYSNFWWNVVIKKEKQYFYLALKLLMYQWFNTEPRSKYKW